MSYKNQSAPYDQPVRSILLVLSGLSGAGKDAVLTRLKESCPFKHITTVTTRPRRASERDNVDYHFVSKERFQAMIERDELLEWAEVYDNWYGVPRKPVKQALDRGQDVVIKVDVQGAATIKKILPQAVFIFVTPPSMEELVLRLKERRTGSPAELALRTKTAEEELKQLHLFDYVVFNRQDEIDRAVADIEAIITAEKCRVKPREISL
jgi:guanylate kinase